MHCSFGGAEESGPLGDLGSVPVPAAPHEHRGEHRAGCAGGSARAGGEE